MTLTIKEMRLAAGMSQAAFGSYFGIPMRTIQNWENEVRTPPEYVLQLIHYKLINEHMIEPRE